MQGSQVRAVIEQAHLQALYNENTITIAAAEAARSRSTAAAYTAQQEIIERFNSLPDLSELQDELPEPPAPSMPWASEAITIAGLPFQNCPVEGCDIMTDHRACPVHEGGTQ